MKNTIPFQFELGAGCLIAWISLLLFIPLAYLIYHIFNVHPDLAAYQELFSIPPAALFPELGEQATYFFSIAYFPSAIIGLTYLFSRYPPSPSVLKVSAWGTALAVSLFSVAALTPHLSEQMATANYLIQDHPIWMTMSLSSALSVVLLRANYRSSSKYGLLFAEIFSYCLILTAALFSTFRVLPQELSFHFGAYFYSIIAVARQKVLLNNLFNTYGLYPHLLYPIFHFIPLSVFSLTVIFSSIKASSYWFLYRFIRMQIRIPALGFVGFLAIIELADFLPRIETNNFDPYFQYNPHRMIFISVFLFLCAKFFKTPSQRLYYLIWFLCPFSILWNFETGLFIALSWLLLLTFREAYLIGFVFWIKGILKHALIGSGVVALGFSSFILSVGLLTGKFPNLALISQTQKLFAWYGFVMLPMRLLHAWNFYFFVCLAGLIISARFRFKSSMTPASQSLFLLTVLAMFGFSYFAGRSHDLNLFGPGYLIILILQSIADLAIQQLKNQQEVLLKWAAFSALLPISSLMLAFANDVYPTLKIVTQRIDQISNPQPTELEKECNTIKSWFSKNEPVLVIGNDSTLIHLFTDTAPTIQDNLSEMFYNRDWETMYHSLEDHSIPSVILESPTGAALDKAVGLLKSHYSNVATSPKRMVQVYK